MGNTFLFVVGARPNFMKAAPILRALRRESGGHVRSFLVHTGQHYDDRLSRQFFIDLELPNPDVNLEVGSADHGAQTGEIMKRLEPVVQQVNPACVVVFGDVNSTLAGALVAAKLNIPIAHVEAGLRSLDRRMPEEVNRVVTDVLSDLLFVTEPAGMSHLKQEGIALERAFLVGDVLIDSVARALPRAIEEGRAISDLLPGADYGLLTFHRPSNVDDPRQLEAIVHEIAKICHRMPFVFPIHPRTESRLKAGGLYDTLSSIPNLFLYPPLGYLQFLGLLAGARVVVTDSGGIQGEAVYVRTPCLTMRDTTERPETIEIGANRLLGVEPGAISPAVEEVAGEDYQPPPPPRLMDGKASERIVEILLDWLNRRPVAPLVP